MIYVYIYVYMFTMYFISIKRILKTEPLAGLGPGGPVALGAAGQAPSEACSTGSGAGASCGASL